MLDLDQKLTLESFQLLLVKTFFIGCPNLRQNSVMFRKLNHFQQHKQNKKNFQITLCTITGILQSFTAHSIYQK